MFPFFTLTFVPQGNPLFSVAFRPAGPVAFPATLALRPDADPEDDPAQAPQAQPGPRARPPALRPPALRPPSPECRCAAPAGAQ
jgi:hypothetical protein